MRYDKWSRRNPAPPPRLCSYTSEGSSRLAAILGPRGGPGHSWLSPRIWSSRPLQPPHICCHGNKRLQRPSLRAVCDVMSVVTWLLSGAVDGCCWILGGRGGGRGRGRRGGGGGGSAQRGGVIVWLLFPPDIPPRSRAEKPWYDLGQPCFLEVMMLTLKPQSVRLLNLFFFF